LLQARVQDRGQTHVALYLIYIFNNKIISAKSFISSLGNFLAW